MISITWFAFFTRPRHEKCVLRHLTERDIEGFRALARTTYLWTNRRKVVSELPLFPSYLFVNIAPKPRIQKV
jgi:hypothetical protein